MSRYAVTIRGNVTSVDPPLLVFFYIFVSLFVNILQLRTLILKEKTTYVSLVSGFNVNTNVQLDATVCRHLFTAQSLYMFRVSQHPTSGVLKTVSATSGIPIPEVADTVFSTPDDGCCDARNM